MVRVKAGLHEVKPTSCEKLLGCIISEDLRWRRHILESNQSIIIQLNSRINGLSRLSTRADFKTRLMVANGIIMSKICYLIPLWGGCGQNLIHALQVQQNKAARIVTRAANFTSTRRLLKECGWLSIKQLVLYHTILLVHKIILNKKPLYLSNRLDTTHGRYTRQESSGCIRMDDTFRSNSSLTSDSFRHRGAKEYNALPYEIRKCSVMATFKIKLKEWIRSNVEIQ